MSTTEHSKPATNPDVAEESIEGRTDSSGNVQDGPHTVTTTESHDVESDPARNDVLGQDWVDEGGATPQGPATSSE